MTDLHLHQNSVLRRDQVGHYLRQNGVREAALLARCWLYSPEIWENWLGEARRNGIYLVPGTEIHLHFDKPEMVSLVVIGCDLTHQPLIDLFGPSHVNLAHYRQVAKRQFDFLMEVGYRLPSGQKKRSQLASILDASIDNPIDAPRALLDVLVTLPENYNFVIEELMPLVAAGATNEWRYMPIQAWLLDDGRRAPTLFELAAIVKLLYANYCKDSRYRDELVSEYTLDNVLPACRDAGGTVLFSLEKPGDEQRLEEYLPHLDGVAVVSTRNRFNWQPERCVPVVQQELLDDCAGQGKLVISGSDWDFYNRAPGINIDSSQFPPYVRQSTNLVLN